MSDESAKRGRVRAATLGRNNPLTNELMEERKSILFDRQATDYADWSVTQPAKPKKRNEWKEED